MSKYVVYQTSVDGPFQTIERQPSDGASDINLRIAEKSGLEFGSVNWFGASSKSDTPEKAIAEARAQNFKYAEPGRVLGLEARARIQAVKARSSVADRRI